MGVRNDGGWWEEGNGDKRVWCPHLKVNQNWDSGKIIIKHLNLNNKNFEIWKSECDCPIFLVPILNEKFGIGSLTTICSNLIFNLYICKFWQFPKCYLRKTSVVLTFVPWKYNFEVHIVLIRKKRTKHSILKCIKMSDLSFFKNVTVPIFNQATERDDWAQF